MNSELKEIQINGISYVQKSSDSKPAVSVEGLEYVVIRAQSAGVFAGYLKDKRPDEVTLVNVRRLWYWSGAASCSQLASQGTSRPKECKFTAPNSKIIIKNWIEILPATEKARDSIQGVAVWEA